MALSHKETDTMFKVDFYEDRQGNQPVKVVLKDLRDKAKTSKDARIQYQKILTFIRALEEYGTRIGEPTVKHIVDGIWELRPLAHRIFFFYWKENKFILLHHFIKKSQKTPPNEVDQARRNMQDFLERNDWVMANENSTSFSDFYNDDNNISSTERAKIEFEVELIGKLVELREAKGLTQAQLAEAAGVKQSALARLEKLKATPQIDTLFKLLTPMGYKLTIVPNEDRA